MPSVRSETSVVQHVATVDDGVAIDMALLTELGARSMMAWL
jgi:hypothetical protein